MPFDQKTAAPLSTRIRQTLGPNGEHWGKGDLCKHGRACLMGAAMIAEGTLIMDLDWESAQAERLGELLDRAIRRIEPVGTTSCEIHQCPPGKDFVAGWNDECANWSQIVAVLDELSDMESARAYQALVNA